ncbi:MAG TPA: hypothetical protein VHF08_02005 [Nitrososphaeraceae archaeon]|nr:hypothetical protein [Nitrososphaeraceae archaeon]
MNSKNRRIGRVQWGQWDLSLPGRRVHLLYFRTEERKKENLVYEKSR